MYLLVNETIENISTAAELAFFFTRFVLSKKTGWNKLPTVDVMANVLCLAKAY